MLDEVLDATQRPVTIVQQPAQNYLLKWDERLIVLKFARQAYLCSLLALAGVVRSTVNKFVCTGRSGRSNIQ